MQVADFFDKPRSAERILIIQLGDIGDVVWSLPAIQAIRDSYPEASVSVLLREGIGSLAERKRAEAITDACPGRVFNMAGKTTLGELAGLP